MPRQPSGCERSAIRVSVVVDDEVVVVAVDAVVVAAGEKRKRRMHRSSFVTGSCGGGRHEGLEVKKTYSVVTLLYLTYYILFK